MFRLLAVADIDRNNASQARLAGFEADLGLKGQEFATVLSIVYGKPWAEYRFVLNNALIPVPLTRE